MALQKPFQLIVSYQLEPERSELTAPFNLNATYDPIAGGGGQNITGIGFDSLEAGNVKTTYPQYVNPITYVTNFFGQTNILNKNKYIFPGGLVATVFGNPFVKNVTDQLFPPSISGGVFGRPTIYNLRQYIRLGGMHTAVFGTAYMQGGVKYVEGRGFSASAFGSIGVINTRGEQYVNLNIPSRGIAPPNVVGPQVSPRFIRPAGHIATLFGQTTLQRPPHPKGFIASLFGTAWISHSPRYLIPANTEAYISGYAKVFDPTQKIWVTGVNTVIPGGVFGDIGIKNTRRRLEPKSFLSEALGDWSSVVSNRRLIEVTPWDSFASGDDSLIYNKAPSVIPHGFNSLVGFNSIDIGYRVRQLLISGFNFHKFGHATLTKTPELKTRGFDSVVIGGLTISNRVRNIYAGIGSDQQRFGGITTWHYSRTIRLEGWGSSRWSKPSIEHQQRELLAKGSLHSLLGNNAWLSYRVRLILPKSIEPERIPIHRVGGTQHISFIGFDASRFGERIIPESLSVFPQGFVARFGWPTIDLKIKYAKPIGFLTNGQEGAHRFGTARVWNLRQYVIQVFDVNNGLVPPKWIGWTAISNRNRIISTLGVNTVAFGRSAIINKATPLLPKGFSALTIPTLMIAERIRKVRFEGMEAPYISGWVAIHNAADVLLAEGINSQRFGNGQIINTRRYYPRVGNFESLIMGLPMIADRIRYLGFEHRYTIQPPYLALPKVDLHTRYIADIGHDNEMLQMGNPSLEIHWKIITPRWTLRNAYGDATVKNVTPEMKTRGRDAAEFGQTFVRLQWRPLPIDGAVTELFGRSEIAFRDRKLQIIGFTHWNVPRPHVVKTGIPPYYPQYIWLDNVDIDGDEKRGHGIELPKQQVPMPLVESNVVFPQGFTAGTYGSHHIQSNGILVEPGLQELIVGSPNVTLKNRTITVPTLGDLLEIKDVKPRLSPWTIYAVMEAPAQATKNHDYANLHFVNSSGGYRAAGEVFGRVIITLQHRIIRNATVGLETSVGRNHHAQLRLRYINLHDHGIRSLRTGVHVVGPFDQNIIQFDSIDMALYGRPEIVRPSYLGPQTIKVPSTNSLSFSQNRVELLNRNILAKGTQMTQMGTRKSADQAFMWQGLRVGPLIKGNYGGWQSDSFGTTFISLKVREITIEGSDQLTIGYDYTQFDKRMRVLIIKPTLAQKNIHALGFDAIRFSVPNIKPAVHYIRPDGNADQFRKGAF